MKKINNFLSFIELPTKSASVLPFLLGTGYYLQQYGKLDIEKTLIFFVAMALFDMATTAINNHIGTRQHDKENHYPDIISLGLIFFMVILAAVLGIYLVTVTNLIVLLTGIFCFGIGIFYSFGPLPISSTPFGEVISGVVQGTCIPFLVHIINDPDLLYINLSLPRMTVSFDLVRLICLGVVVLPLICSISNIMLANNLCDVEEDVKVKRFTLPYYIGTKHSLKLFQLLYGTSFFFIALGIITRILPITAILGFVGIVPIFKNIRIFNEKQIKSQTFHVSVKNFLLLNVPYTAGIWLAFALNIIF